MITGCVRWTPGASTPAVFVGGFHQTDHFATVRSRQRGRRELTCLNCSSKFQEAWFPAAGCRGEWPAELLGGLAASRAGGDTLLGRPAPPP